MCCCVRAERAVHAPGGARCAPRSLAHRLRRIGDELEKRWATGGDNNDDHNNNNSSGSSNHHHHHHHHHHQDDNNGKSSEETGRVSVTSMHLLCTAIQVTVLVLFVGWRHL